MLALAAHILKLNDTEKISMAPGQEWHADSWSIPYFSSCRSKRMLAIKRCKHFELGGDNKRKGQVIQFWALGFFCSYVSRGKCWSYRKIAWMRINTVISLLKKKKDYLWI